MVEVSECKSIRTMANGILANFGRLSEDRFSRYYCDRCGKEYPGSPLLSYENPNEELQEGVILIERGEYKWKACNNIIALLP